MKFTDIFIIDDTTSIIKVLLIYYLLIMNSCADSNLLSKRSRSLIKNNRYIQHIIGCMTLFVLISLLHADLDVTYILGYTILYYLIYLFSTKVDIHWSIVIITMLFIAYAYEYESKIKKYDIINDSNLSDDIKQEQLLLEANTHSLFIWGIILLIGLGNYFNNNTLQYGGGNDIIKRILN